MGFESYYTRCPSGMSNWARSVAAQIPLNGRANWIHTNIPRFGYPCPSYSVDIGEYERMANEIWVSNAVNDIEALLAAGGNFDRMRMSTAEKLAADAEAARLEYVRAQELAAAEAYQLQLKTQMLQSPTTTWATEETYRIAVSETNQAIDQYNVNLPATTTTLQNLYNSAAAAISKAESALTGEKAAAGAAQTTPEATTGQKLESGVALLLVPAVILVMAILLIFKRR